MDFIAERKRCALWAAPGMGKTVISYTYIDALLVAGLLTKPALVIGPLRVARDTWTDEVQKWEHLRDLETSFIGGTKQQRAAALKRDVPIFTTNYEQLPWLIDTIGEDNWPFGMVVADESTKLKGYRTQQGGRRSGALGKVAFKSEYWLNLTGTPAPNGLVDLWGQTWFLDEGQRLGRTYTAFVERWFYRPPRDGGENEQRQKLIPFRHSEKEIHNALRDLCLTLDPKDWFDIKEPIVTPVMVKLPPAARKIYDEFERTMYAELADSIELEVFNAAALTNKCLQIANGAVYGGTRQGAATVEEIDECDYRGIHDAKLEALESVMSELNVPPLIAYQFRSDKERILKAFPKIVDLSTKRGMAAFKAGDAPGGVAHPKSMGHGIDGLQDVTNALIRFGHDWNLEERLQMLERIGPVRQAQSGYDRAVLVFDLIAEDTIDETVIARHESKRQVQDLLLEAMKHHRPMLAA